MVANKLDENTCLEKAEQLDFPNSVIDFLRGDLGQIPGGFPEPFRSRVVKDKPIINGRPGANVPAHDFPAHLKKLQAQFPETTITDLDVLSSTQFPKVFEEYMSHYLQYGNVTNLPTRQFLAPMQVGEEVTFTEQGKQFNVKLVAVKDFDPNTSSVPVHFEINGKSYVSNIKAKEGIVPFIQRTGTKAGVVAEAKEKANPSNPGSLGASMPGKVVEIKVKVGDSVKKGDAIIVLSAMKMETIVRAHMTGTVSRVVVKQDDSVSAGDLLLEVTA